MGRRVRLEVSGIMPMNRNMLVRDGSSKDDFSEDDFDEDSEEAYDDYYWWKYNTRMAMGQSTTGDVDKR